MLKRSLLSVLYAVCALFFIGSAVSCQYYGEAPIAPQRCLLTVYDATPQNMSMRQLDVRFMVEGNRWSYAPYHLRNFSYVSPSEACYFFFPSMDPAFSDEVSGGPDYEVRPPSQFRGRIVFFDRYTRQQIAFIPVVVHFQRRAHHHPIVNIGRAVGFSHFRVLDGGSNRSPLVIEVAFYGRR